MNEVHMQFTPIDYTLRFRRGVRRKIIKIGANSSEYFAIASGVDGVHYIDLKFNQFVEIVEKSGYLVKVEVAKKQIEEQEAKHRAEAENQTGANTTGDAPYVYPLPTEDENASRAVCEDSESEKQTPKNRRFFMSAELDTTRINRDVQKYVEEIIQHLTSVDGVRVRVSLEVEAQSAEGFSAQTVRTISENCQTMHVRDSGFEAIT